MALNETIYEYINDGKTKEIFQNWQDFLNRIGLQERIISEIEKLKNDLN